MHFVTKDIGKSKYFLGIEFAYTRGRMALPQRKYALDLLLETGLMGCKLESTPVDQSLDFWDNTSSPFEDVGGYKRLIRKLIYLIVTRPNIAYIVGVLVNLCMNRGQYTDRELYKCYLTLRRLLIKDWFIGRMTTYALRHTQI